jgi:hypothetical protein
MNGFWKKYFSIHQSKMLEFLKALLIMFTAARAPPMATCREALDIFGREWTSHGIANQEMTICSYPENMRLVLEACNEEESHENDQCVDAPQRAIQEIKSMLRHTVARRASVGIRENCLTFGKDEEEEPHKYISNKEL